MNIHISMSFIWDKYYCWRSLHQVFEHMHGGIDMKDGIVFQPILLHAKSRGTITLASNLPTDSPIIDPQYLSHPDDVKVLVEGENYYYY